MTDDSPLVSAADLSVSLEAKERVALLDVRWAGPGSADGYVAYLAGHLPGAVHVDLENALSGPPSPTAGGRHPLPSRDRFQRAMRDAGVTNAVAVVIYDDWYSIAAARAWWLLRLHGHSDVRILDGGLGAWTALGGPLELGDVVVERGDFIAEQPRLPVLDAAEAAALADSGVLLDGRPHNRYLGRDETVDPVAGHIPGAESLPALELVRPDGRLLPAPELRQRFDAVGAGGATPIGAYCGSGVQACHVALAAAVAGLGDIGVYAGSWSDWITDPARPVA